MFFTKKTNCFSKNVRRYEFVRFPFKEERCKYERKTKIGVVIKTTSFNLLKSF